MSLHKRILFATELLCIHKKQATFQYNSQPKIHTRDQSEITMGCVKSSNNNDRRSSKHIRIRKSRPWSHPLPITRDQLNAMREEFWHTSPYYGGQREIWDALRAAADPELHLAQAIIDSAGIIVQEPDLTVCYDERGARYELPGYVLSEPTNLTND